MLQHHPWLLESCDISPGEQLIKSHACARLNGYIGGYGRPADLQAEGVKLGLNEKMVEYVLKQMKSKPNMTATISLFISPTSQCLTKYYWNEA